MSDRRIWCAPALLVSDKVDVSALLAISVDFFYFFFSDDSLQSLNIYAGFNSALKSEGGRCSSGIKALCGLREAGPLWRCCYSPRRCLAGSGVSLELDPELVGSGRAGRAPMQDQARFIA